MDPSSRTKINVEVVELLVVVDLLSQALLEKLVQGLIVSFGSSFLSPSCEHLLS
jgi:hypothetical protein